MSLKSQTKKFKLLIILLVVIVLVLLLIIYSRRNNFILDPSLRIETAAVRDIEQIVSSEGNIEGLDTRFVNVGTQSKIKELNFQEGDIIKKDQVIAVIETGSGISKKEEEILAPIKGTLIKSLLKVGDYGSATQPAFIVSDLSDYQINLNINENDIVNLKIDQFSRIILPAISIDAEYEGKVTYISSSPSSSNGVVNYEVTITPDSLPSELKIGMSADVEIVTDSREDVLSIPESFLIERDDNFYVKLLTWKNEEKTNYDVLEKEVKIGLRTDEYVEITSGLSNGDELAEPSYAAQGGFSLFR